MLALDDLIAARDKLLKTIGSGIAEIENPQLGRTAYQSAGEIQRSLATINAEIARLSGVSGASVTIIQSNRNGSTREESGEKFYTER